MIEQACLPTATEVQRAHATLERLESGVGSLEDGEFVDAAALGAAQQTIALADRYGTAG